MKKHFLLIVILLICSQGFINAQNSNQELLRIRDRNYNHYRAFKDTMSIRTWFNMVELSKRLEEVVNVDNVLIDTLLKQKTLIQKPIIPKKNESQRIVELRNSKNELTKEVARLNAHKESLSKRKNFYAIGGVLSLLALLIILGSYISYVQKNKGVIKSQKNSKKNLLEVKQTHQNELNKFIKDDDIQKKEIERLGEEIEKLKEEKELLENSASAMKQSYDVLKEREVEKKEELKEEIKEAPAVSEDELAEIRREINTLSDEVAQIITEKHNIEEKLNETTSELERQKKMNNSIGGDIEGLLKKLKGDEE